MIRRRYRILFHTVGICIVLLALFPSVLYIPSVQQWAVEQVASYLNHDPSSPLVYSVGRVRIGFPADLRLERVQARWRADSTICLSLKRLETGITHFPIGESRFLSLSAFRLTGLELGIDSLTSSVGVRGSVPSLQLRGISVDVERHHLLVESLSLDAPDLSLYLGPSQRRDSVSEPSPWQFDVGHLLISDGRIRYHNSDSSLIDALTDGPRTPYFDYNRLLFDSLSIDVGHLSYNDSLLSFDLRSATALESYSGLQINGLQTLFSIDRAIHLRELTLTTDASHLSGDFSLDWHTLQGSTHLDGVLSPADLTRFVSPYYPDWKRSWPSYPATLFLSAQVDDDDVTIDTLSLRIPRHLLLDGHATLLSLRDTTAGPVIHTHLQAGLLSADCYLSSFVAPPSRRSYRLPDATSLQLRLDYDSLSAQVMADLRTPASGAAEVSASYHHGSGRYCADLVVSGLDVTAFAPDVPLRDAWLSCHAEGSELDFSSPHAYSDLTFCLDSIIYLGAGERRVPISQLTGTAGLHEGFYSAQLQHPYFYSRLTASPGALYLSIHSGDCDVTSDIMVSLDQLPDCVSRLTRVIHQAMGETSLDLPAISGTLPPLVVQVDMGQHNPILPLLNDNGISFSEGHLALAHSDALYGQADVYDFHTAGGFSLDTLHLDLQPLADSLYEYECRLVHRSMKRTDSYCIQAGGQLHTDSLTTRLRYYDAAYRPISDQQFSLSTRPDSLTLRLLTDPVILDRRFQVHPETYVQLTHLPTTPTHDPQPLSTVGRLAFDLDSVPVIRAGFTLNDHFSAELQLQQLPLSLLDVFTAPTLQFGGTLSGYTSITASLSDLQRTLSFDGGLFLTDGALSLPSYGMRLTLPADVLMMSRNQLHIRDYPLTADGGGVFHLGGQIDFREDLSNPAIGLTLRADHAYLLHQSQRRSPRQLLAGTLPVNSDIRVVGRLSALRVQGDVQLLEGTDLTYWLTEDPLQTGSKTEQLIDFVSFAEIDREIQSHTQPIKGEQVNLQKGSEGLSLLLHADISQASHVQAYLSPLDDSRINFIGGGPLQIEMPARGDLLLSGTYNILSGTVDYKLPMLPVSKHFDLRSGSEVRWPGVIASDPTIHLIAGQDIRTTVSDQTSGTRLVTFAVDANIEGTLSQMGVSFDCKAPDDAVIATELQAMTDEERQSQALLLLIAQIYAGPSANSSSNAGLATANAALNSLIGRELDGITSGLKHTKVNVGLDSYDDQGTSHTDLSVKVSQSLFNDRVRVTVGGKVKTAGNDYNNSQSTASLGDVSLDWMIHRDGTQYLDLFRRTNYQNILEGQVIEMGAGYVQERTAYRFLDLFSPSLTRRQNRILEFLKTSQPQKLPTSQPQ